MVRDGGQASQTGVLTWAGTGPRAGTILIGEKTTRAALRPDSDGTRRACISPGPNLNQTRMPARGSSSECGCSGRGAHGGPRGPTHNQRLGRQRASLPGLDWRPACNYHPPQHAGFPGTRQTAGTRGKSAARAGARSRHGVRAERGQRPECMERAAQGRRRARNSEPEARYISQSVQSVEDQRRRRRQPLVTGLPGHDTDRFSRHERGAAGRTGIPYNPKPGSSCKVEDWLDFRRPPAHRCRNGCGGLRYAETTVGFSGQVRSPYPKAQQHSSSASHDGRWRPYVHEEHCCITFHSKGHARAQAQQSVGNGATQTQGI